MSIHPDQTTRAVVALDLDTLPPSVNHQYITTKHGGKALTDQAVAFRQRVWAACVQAGYRAAPDGPLCLTMRITFGNKRRADLDNRWKSAIDALQLALHFDDSRIVEQHGYARQGDAARCELTLEAAQ